MMMVENGINIEVIWADQDVIEVALWCSNGYFSGLAELYLGYDDLPDLVSTFRGFPSSKSDTRQVELGTFDPTYANGGVRLNFYCRDSGGHASVDVKLRGDGCKGFGEMESVAFRMPIEAAGMDAFVEQVMSIGSTIGESAHLPMTK